MIIRGRLLLWVVLAMVLISISCERDPELYLHDKATGCLIDFPKIEMGLDVLWDYELIYGTDYDWEAEWYYGWDDEDRRIFGQIGYSEPSVFNIRCYFLGRKPDVPHKYVSRHTISGTKLKCDFNWGYWDILAWNDIQTIDGVQSLIFDEETTLDYVTARTNQTMYPSRYNAPKYQQSFYEPEALFAGYEQDLHIHGDMEGFDYDSIQGLYVRKLDMKLEPVTYIYLTQVVLRNNRGRIVAIDGNGNLSNMARSVNLNTGVAGQDAITVNYNLRMKNNCDMNGEKVDIIGGRLLTFGLCNINANRVTRADGIDERNKHYMDVKMLFNNGMDSTFVFDVTKQVNTRFKGGVITVELDVDEIPIPQRGGGSGFDAVVKDYEEEEYVIPM